MCFYANVKLAKSCCSYIRPVAQMSRGKTMARGPRVGLFISQINDTNNNSNLKKLLNFLNLFFFSISLFFLTFFVHFFYVFFSWVSFSSLNLFFIFLTLFSLLLKVFFFFPFKNYVLFFSELFLLIFGPPVQFSLTLSAPVRLQTQLWDSHGGSVAAPSRPISSHHVGRTPCLRTALFLFPV